jgi:pimeloyl-ACP methyl ester carboxylesterase
MPAARGRETALTAREAGQVEAANASARPPVVFIHGLWVLASCWDRWVTAFEEAGYAALTPGWPGDPETVTAAREHPEAFARQRVAHLVDHLAAIVGHLTMKPAVVGHSFGGLLAEILAGRGITRASVVISPAPFRGVLPVPISTVRSVLPVVRNPANRRRVVSLSYAQFRYSVANATSEEEARALYETHGVPAYGGLLFQAALANLNPRSEVRVDTGNPGRGPLLVVSAEQDRFLPWSIARSSYRRLRRNSGVTEIVEIAGRGHSLIFDDGWREVVAVALEFLRRFD